MILARTPRPQCNHNSAATHNPSVRILRQPTQVRPSPESFSEIFSRNSLYAVENSGITKPHFFKHGHAMMKNVFQVPHARSAYFDFHSCKIVGAFARMVGTKWFCVEPGLAL
jgi:hypothetical protein